MGKPETQQLIPVEVIERRIYLIRGQKVILDRDLARLYQVPTFRLNEAVKRNRSRFPEDFMFQLTAEESRVLTSQIAISKPGRGGRRTPPFAFTEHGVAMLSSVLNSKRAVQIDILIIRAFVRLREILATHKDLARKLENLERKYKTHDLAIREIFDTIRNLMVPPTEPKRRIGFTLPAQDKPQK